MKALCLSLARRSACLVSLALPAAASTWIVDDDGGVGVNFTDLPPAIAAAQPGDVLLVRAGTYSGFACTKALRILGEPGVHCSGVSTWSGSSSGSVGVLTDFVFDTTGMLTVSNCQGPMVLQRFEGSLKIDASSDVRMLDSSTRVRLVVTGSRLELARTSCLGYSPGNSTQPSDGYPALSVISGFAHIALSDLRGGDGGDLKYDPSSTWPPGTGGPGLQLLANGTAVVVGTPNHLIQGGDAGEDPTLLFCGEGGNGADVASFGGNLWHSGVTFLGGSSLHPACANGQPIVGSNVAVVPEDPSLELLGATTPGATITFRVRGPAGSNATIRLGRTPIVAADGLAQIEQLTQKLRVLNVGVIPASGQADRNFTLPVVQPGLLFVAQAELTLPDTTLRRSNSTPIVVR